MYWQKRKNRLGETYYSFVQWDSVSRKNVRLRASEVPSDITTDAQADAFCRLREAEEEASKLRIQRKLAWQKKYYDFTELIYIFEIEAKKRAPNSWQGPLYYLQQYALDFFLNEKQCNNLNNWPLYFEEFRDWLMTVPPSKTTKTGKLSFSSKNNIIGSVNLFLSIMNKKGKSNKVEKCQKFPRHLLNRRDASDVISHEESKVILNNLEEVDGDLSRDFFLLLLNSGLRLSEALGLSILDFFPGSPKEKIISGALDRHDLNCYGYISLESQLKNPVSPRNTRGEVLRKPLKGRKRINAKASRIIPIFDKETFNALAKRYNRKIDEFEIEKFGKKKSNYLLFEGLNKNKFSSVLKKAYRGTSYKIKSAHCARHTFATHFAGMTNADTGLCRLVLGHKDEETTLSYVHLFEQINRNARAKQLIKKKIDLVS